LAADSDGAFSVKRVPTAFYAGFAVMGFYKATPLAPQTATCVDDIVHFIGDLSFYKV
jgi:hypothetical protein